MRTLTVSTAQKFLSNYRAISDPFSLSYNDNYCGSYLNDEMLAHGFKSQTAMAKACRELLGNNKPAPKGKKVAKLHIEVIKFMGKFGAFAASEQVMYRAEIVGVNGKRKDAGNWQGEGEGNPDRKYADQDAKEWAKLLSCPIVFVDKIPKAKKAGA